MKKVLIVLLVSISFSVTSIRNDLMYDFLNLGANARIQALGNTGLVNATDAEAVLYNPANIFNYPQKNLVFSLNPLYFDSSHLYLFYLMDSLQDPYSKLGFGFIRYSMEGIEGRGYSPSTLPTSMISASDMAFIVATSRLLSYSTSVGFSVGMIASNYKSSSLDFFMNFGVNHLASELKLKLNSTIQIYNDAGYKISIGGLSYFNPQLKPSCVIDMYSHNSFSAIYFSLGLEYLYSSNLKFLCGYNRDQLSAGVGTILMDNTDFYYAATFTDLGVRHQFSFSIGI